MASLMMISPDNTQDENEKRIARRCDSKFRTYTDCGGRVQSEMPLPEGAARAYCAKYVSENSVR
jgi:hypothetical protein